MFNLEGLKQTIFPIEKICNLKVRCDERFTHALTACGCVFKEITLVGSNQGNYFENATACCKRTLKTTVATQLITPCKISIVKLLKQFYTMPCTVHNFCALLILIQ